MNLQLSVEELDALISWMGDMIADAPGGPHDLKRLKTLIDARRDADLGTKGTICRVDKDARAGVDLPQIIAVTGWRIVGLDATDDEWAAILESMPSSHRYFHAPLYHNVCGLDGELIDGVMISADGRLAMITSDVPA